jgi:hypothetical protein
MSSIALPTIGAIFGSYVVTSVVLLKWPHLLWGRERKKPSRMFDKCTHISHRGGAGEYLENTMQAFKRFVDLWGGAGGFMEREVY